MQAGHALPSADLRGQKSSDPVPHQAHSLAMRCPGDDIPLLGNNQRMQQPHYNLQDPATSTQRFRMPPTVLSQPLISFNGLNSRDGKTRPLSSRPLFGNVADANHRTFPGVSADRDQYTLPSMHGVPGQAALQSTIPNQRTDARPQVSDPVQARPGLEFQGRTQEAMPEDVVALNRGGGVIQDLDGRHGTNTYSQWGGTRAMRPTSGNTYSDTLDSQAPQHIAYGNSQDFFVQQHTFRTDDRNTTTAGLKYNGVHNSVHNDKGYPDTQPIMTPGHSATAGLGAFMDPNSAQAQYRQQNAKPRAAPIGSDGRMSLMQVGALHPVREVDEAPAHLGESNRPSDDGRFTIENILMQHKNGAQNQ